MLFADLTRGDAARPVGDPGYPYAALGQVHLAAHQRPVVGEALAAVVAGEHQQGVVGQTEPLQRGQHPANAFVHVVDHPLVGVDVAAIEVHDAIAQCCGQAFVVARLPGPVRRGVVQAQKQRLTGGAHAFDKVDRVVSDQVGQVARLALLLVAQVQVMLAGGVAVCEIVDPARHRPKELVVATFQGAEVGWVAQMPLAHQRRVVASAAQQ